MATNFGVQLKKPDGVQSGSQSNTKRLTGIRREFQSKPMSDIKAMFEKGTEGSGGKPSEPGTSFAKKMATSKNQSATTTTNKTSAIKTKSNVTPSNQKRETFQKSDALTADDIAAFDMLKHEIESKGADHLDDEVLPSVAVAKVYDGGQTYKATVEKKAVTKTKSGNDNTEVTKSEAASMLSFGLTKLRTRPGSLKNEDNNLQTSLVENVDSSAMKDNKTETGAVKGKITTSSPAKNKLGDSKYIPGVPRGWKGAGDEKNGRSSPSLDENKSTGQIKSDITDTRNGQRSLVRTISPVTRNSSSDSSVGNLSPRGYKPPYTKEQTCSNNTNSGLKAESDVNKNIKKFEPNSKLVSKVNEKNKVNDSKADKKEDLESIKSHLKPTGDLKSGNKNAVSGNNTSSLAGQDVRWKDKNKGNLGGVSKPLHRISSSSSTESSSSLSKSETVGVKSRIDRFGSPEPQKANSTVGKTRSPDLHAQHKTEYVNIGLTAENTELRKKKFMVSRRMSAEKFQDLKKGFEKSSDNQEQNIEIRRRVEVIPTKKILEKRESFENPEIFHKKEVKKEICSPISKKKLLERKDSFEHPELHRKKSGPVEIVTLAEKGRVLQTVRSLNELDEAAHARPQIKHRSNSLPSSGIEDDIDSSGYYEDVEHDHGPYYHDIRGVKLADDASNEGDISSEADQIYEEIDALRKAGKGKTELAFCLLFILYIVFIPTTQ